MPLLLFNIDNLAISLTKSLNLVKNSLQLAHKQKMGLLPVISELI
jgi:hypothetical protein